MAEHVIQFHIVGSGGSGGGSGGGGAGSGPGGPRRAVSGAHEDKESPGSLEHGAKGALGVASTLGLPGSGAAQGIAGAAEGVAGAAALGVVASAAAVAGLVAIIGKMSFEAVRSYGMERAQIGQNYNGAIAGSMAHAEVDKMQSDMAVSNYLAPQISKLVDSQSHLNDAWDKAAAELGRVFLPVADVVVRALTWMLDKFNEFIPATLEMYAKLYDWMAKTPLIGDEMTKHLKDTAAGTREVVKQMRQMLNGKDKKMDVGTMMLGAAAATVGARNDDAAAFVAQRRGPGNQAVFGVGFGG